MSENRQTQIFSKFSKALTNLERALTLPEKDEDYRNSAILAYMLTFEQCWKSLKWLLKDKIGIEVNGPKPVIQEAFKQSWLGNDDGVWLNMADDRNQIAHTYNNEQTLKLYMRIKEYTIIIRKAHDLLANKYVNE